MTPKLPLITFYRISAIDLITGEYPLDQTTLYGLFKEKSDKARYFDSTGTVWQCDVSSKYKQNFLNRLIANTINPTIKIERVWTKTGSYSLHELKSRISDCIDKDNDILTQYIEADGLKSRINNCSSFECIVGTLMRFVFNPDTTLVESRNP
jgi:hypothetical protein